MISVIKKGIRLLLLLPQLGKAVQANNWRHRLFAKSPAGHFSRKHKHFLAD